MKYRGENEEYLVYDTVKYHDVMKARTVRIICSRGCGAGAAGIMVGPVNDNGSLTMKMFSPDGEEQPLGEEAKTAGACYLKDAGYIRDAAPAGRRAAVIGKVFLSEDFVSTYMHTA